MEDPSQCRAQNISDEKRCLEKATSVNGLFCAFHAKQCAGLYRGYKLRNARLDRLTANPPQYLKETKLPLYNLTFEDVNDHVVLKGIHDHLFERLQLYERVIRARKLHGKSFYSDNLDYGHTKFIESLASQKSATLLAIERIEKRSTEMLYKQKKWYTWVRECQAEEEKNKEKEVKKVKAEAAMFRRHWKAAQLRQRDMKAKEDKKRQDAFLEQIYKERMVERERNGETVEDEDEDEMDWDPIEDVLEDSKGSYLDLIQTFLWMTAPEEIMDIVKEDPNGPTSPKSSEASDLPTTPVAAVDEPKAPNSAQKPKSKSKSKSKKKKAPTASGKEAPTPNPEPDKSLIETRQEMHDRLKNGEDFNRDNVVGRMVAGTIENPVIMTKTITYSEDEITRLQNEIYHIKHLLFCRLLLGQAALLPAALRANTVEEFLADEEVTAGALRDLCLKMENPSLQEIRDACADFFRPDDEVDEDDQQLPEEPQESPDPYSDMLVFKGKRKGALPDTWVSKREKAKQAAEAMGMPSSLREPQPGDAIDFGSAIDSSPAKVEKVKVKICGRTIWNYPSSKAMNRGGWLHFCIMAKESSLHDAIGLCRHWDEFFELNILSIWGYFPGKNWVEWVGNRWRQQMLQLGFIVYFESASPDAHDLTIRKQDGGRHGPTRRSHAVFEARNFMCAHIKRDDQASRRLVQYLSMQSHRLLVLVRDAETGQLLIKPPEEERWLYRQKAGLGRSTKNDDWHIIKSVGPEFFDDMDKYRQWSFSFKEYYDVYVWDLEVGEPFPCLYNAVQEMLTKALRCRSPVDLYELAGPVLKTIYKDDATHRVKDIVPGDGHTSIYDHVHGPDVKFKFGKVDDAWGKNASGLVNTRQVFEEDGRFPKNLFYNRADELEDEILFPEERTGQRLDPSQIGKIEPISQWEESLTFQRFIEGWESEYTEDTDGESVELESDWEEEEDFDDDDDDDGSGDESLEDVEEDQSREELDESTDPALSPNELMQGMPWSDELKEAMRKLSLKPPPPDPRRSHVKPTDAYLEKEFMLFLDREKAKVFKEIWHKADLSPHAQPRYIEMMRMTKKCRQFNHATFDCAPTILTFTLIYDLDIVQDKKDLHKAVAKMTPFFHQEFFSSKYGEEFKDSLIFKQEERAKAPRDCRSHLSNKTRPAEFFKEYDEMNKTMKTNEDVPEEWDIATRPIIAHLYKSGVIRTRANVAYAAQAFAGKEDYLDHYDLYTEQRAVIKETWLPPHMKDPHAVPSFKAFSRAFAKKHPNARFAVLSLWSAPHFYPLMLGLDNSNGTAFQDLQGRNFIWKFVPKDMPYSEWSIHLTAMQRVEPFKKFFGDRVVVKREKYLVMGVDEKDLFRLASTTVYAIQMRPWRQEVDLWKSFVNVDAEFVERLDERWME